MEATLKPSLIFDLILLAVLLVSAMASYRKGLLTAIVQFAGRLFSLAGAWFVSREVSPYLFENFLERSFVTRVQGTISQQGVVDLTALVDKYAGFLPQSIQNSIIQSVSQTLDTGAPDVAQTIVTQVVEPLFTPIIAVVVFLIMRTTRTAKAVGGVKGGNTKTMKKVAPKKTGAMPMRI